MLLVLPYFDRYGEVVEIQSRSDPYAGIVVLEVSLDALC
jgi:hypothetical protein